jgi:hypothetical protein
MVVQSNSGLKRNKKRVFVNACPEPAEVLPKTCWRFYPKLAEVSLKTCGGFTQNLLEVLPKTC